MERTFKVYQTSKGYSLEISFKGEQFNVEYLTYGGMTNLLDLLSALEFEQVIDKEDE